MALVRGFAQGLLVFVVAGASACTVLLPLDGYATGESPMDDAARADGPPSSSIDARALDASDASTTDDAGLPNLYPKGDFEKGCQVHGYESTVADDPLAHTGMLACRICQAGTPSNPNFTLDEPVDTTPAVGATYRVEAWVRTVDGAAVPAKMAISLRTHTGGNFQNGEQQASPFFVLDGTWRSHAVTLTVTKSATLLDFFVGGDKSTGACFLVDDVVVQRLP